jgi:hypothetical protein
LGALNFFAGFQDELRAATLTTDREKAMSKVHPDQLGEPDDQGYVRVGVRNWFGPDPVIPGYHRLRVELVHLRTPCRIVTYIRDAQIHGSRAEAVANRPMAGRRDVPRHGVTHAA